MPSTRIRPPCSHPPGRVMGDSRQDCYRGRCFDCGLANAIRTCGLRSPTAYCCTTVRGERSRSAKLAFLSIGTSRPARRRANRLRKMGMMHDAQGLGVSF